LTMTMFEKMRMRVLKDFMDIVILKELRNRSMSAYDVIVFIHKKFQILMSSGTVYATLYSMERDGWVKGNNTEARRVYKLTDEGEKTIQTLLEESDKLQLFLGGLVGDPSQ